jgi:mannitol-specific phosphotransferase system IIBC component
MKKLLLSLLVVISFSAANAQQDSALQKYTGKYKFPDGSPVTEINFTVENGVLMGSSAMGSSEFKKTDTEHVFEIVAYGGTATFKKNGDGKITNVQILVGDINMEGTKSESAPGFQYQLRSVLRK